MPRLRKLSEAESASSEQPTTGTRATVVHTYDGYLADFTIGDYGRAELHAGEDRIAVRQELQAAAMRRGLRLRFRPGRSVALIFCTLEGETPAVSEPAPQSEPLKENVIASRRPLPEKRPAVRPAPARPAQPSRSMHQRTETQAPRPTRRQSSTERYQDVLPRWMREQSARSNTTNRRPTERGTTRRKPRSSG